VTLIAVVVLALTAPWSHGPAAITRAQAALILHRTAAAITPRPGWVFHERGKVFEFVPGTPLRRTATTEIWVVDKPPYNFRFLTGVSDLTSPVETGGQGATGRGFAYDPQTDMLYRQPVERFLPRFEDPAAALRRQIARGRAKVLARTRINGRSVYEIVFAGPASEAQPTPRIFVDASTYVPVRISFMNVGYINGYWWESADDILTYEYLPPTGGNLALADIRRAHIRAAIAPAAKMPAAFRNRVKPPLPAAEDR
jgi:hypothetical protein